MDDKPMVTSSLHAPECLVQTGELSVTQGVVMSGYQ